ncbi:hypothetical protein GH733_004336 [Mirounga leonina]|nr:hypothetical protein GH733_004336 [Mirounga leonina]
MELLTMVTKSPGTVQVSHGWENWRGGQAIWTEELIKFGFVDAHAAQTVNSTVLFDITVYGKSLGYVSIELFAQSFKDSGKLSCSEH